MALELNRDNYEDAVNGAELPMLVDFWGPQCGPCLALMPFVEGLESEYQDRLTVAKVDVSGNRMLCARLRVLSVPTIIFYKGGQEHSRLTGGEVGESTITKILAEILA